jgi:hypothetical protein
MIGWEKPIAQLQQFFFYSGQVNKKGIDAIGEDINQMSREQWSHFPGPICVVTLNGVCELKPMD